MKYVINWLNEQPKGRMKELQQQKPIELNNVNITSSAYCCDYFSVSSLQKKHCEGEFLFLRHRVPFD